MLNALGILALSILLWQPGYMDHAGFLLSFTSVAGVALLAPLLAKPHEDTPISIKEVPSLLARRNILEAKQLLRKGKLKAALSLQSTLPTHSLLFEIGRDLLRIIGESFRIGLAVTLTTLPVVLWFYYRAALAGLFLNLWIIPTTGLLMISGILLLLFPWVPIFSWLTVGILQFYEILCTSFAAIPFHNWIAGKPYLWQILLYYTILIGVLLYKTLPKRFFLHKKRWMNIIMPLVLSIAVFLFCIPKHKAIVIDFLDVGQGDGICIQDEDTVYLIDCGSSNKRGLGEYTLLPYLLSEGITEVDAVFLTHGDTDHYSGVVQLLSMAASEGITIKMLVLPALDSSILAVEFAEIYEAATNYSKPLTIATMEAGMTWQTPNLTFHCLHPSATQKFMSDDAQAYASGNAQSLCLYVERDTFRLLLTGDIEGSGENALLQELQTRDIRDITVLKVAHHGSASSTGSDFLNQLHPQIAVISCGVDNSYGHPHPDLLSRLEAVNATTLTTAQVGSIRLRLSDTHLSVDTFLHTR
jgi:competence protein ComEC